MTKPSPDIVMQSEGASFSAKPFSTYPEDRDEMLALAKAVADASGQDALSADKLADFVSAILTDEKNDLLLHDELVKLLRDAGTMLAFAFQRIHALPRSRDTELASDIGKVLARIQPILKFYDRPVPA